jgi:hypothetical protein
MKNTLAYFKFVFKVDHHRHEAQSIQKTKLIFFSMENALAYFNKFVFKVDHHCQLSNEAQSIQKTKLFFDEKCSSLF